MAIKNISIIGLGLIGGSIAKALRASGNQFNLYAIDKDEILSEAIGNNIIDAKLNETNEVLESDLIFLCTPVDTAINIFKQIAPRLKPNSILTDVCSVKSPFEKIWNEIKKDGIYIGGHPMTGKESGGYSNSDKLLFENTIYILTQKIDRQLKDFRNIIELLGANILYIPAKQHDVIAASVSHLPQLVSVALVNTASLKTDEYNFLDLAAGGFRDMTRIAESDFKVWEPIIKENKNEIITAIDKFALELESLKKILKKNEFEKIAGKFEQARISRYEIPLNSKGFLTPLHDIFVYVKDEPGILSKISTLLYENGINIKDIELLKIRDGKGGTFRLSFSTPEEALKSKELLSKNNIETD
ncbi:MAG: prephenate dehydrogenase/arogenate dehydrogenase family protein [Ignavibacteria bacterium]|jgi:prephenate dehydrogenase